MNSPSRDLTFERTVFFSDAVFAIAITLLIIEVKLPPGHLPFDEAFSHVTPHLFGFLISFLVIGIYWLNHTRLFARLDNVTPTVMRLNLLMLLLVAFLPFPTGVLSERGLEPGVVTFYASSVATLGLMHMILAAVAMRPPTVKPELSRVDRSLVLWRSAMPVLLFGGSALFATAAPRGAMFSWLLLPFLLAVVTFAVARLHKPDLKEPAT